MTDRGAGVVARALTATLAVQVLVTMGTLTIPVMAPTVAEEIGVDPNNVGIYASILYLSAMMSSLVSSGFILRFGAIRASQFCLVATATGIAIATRADLALLILSALVIGLSIGPTTPASSHVLARHSPVHLMSFVFSLKQTGVPLGMALAGAVVPVFVVAFGWRGAAWAVAAVCLACAVLVQTVRKRFDVDLKRDQPLFRGGVIGPLRLVLSVPALRRLSLTSFAYAAMQQSFSVFIVTYLVTGLDVPLIEAGLVLAVGQMAGVAGRIAWGALSDYLDRAQLMLGALGLATTASAIAVAAFTPEWPFALIVLVSAVFGATAIGWNGIYLAEVSRLAPPDQVGRATGGALFVTFAGVFVGPPAFGVLASYTGSYEIGFYILAAFTGISGVSLIRGARRRAAA